MTCNGAAGTVTSCYITCNGAAGTVTPCYMTCNGAAGTVASCYMTCNGAAGTMSSCCMSCNKVRMEKEENYFTQLITVQRINTVCFNRLCIVCIIQYNIPLYLI